MNSRLGFFIIFLVFTTRIACNDAVESLKNVLMYLTEPMIFGEKFNKVELDGARSGDVVPFLDGIMENTLSKIDSKPNFHPELLRSFRTALQPGFQIFKKIYSGEDSSVTQQFVLDTLSASAGEWIYIPVNWMGNAPHAIVIGIRVKIIDSVRNYDLAVINSGDGTEYHYSKQDPNGVYPVLTKLWISFENIPKIEIFDETFWFIEGLKRIADREYSRKIQDMPLYFYGSFLSNFKREYLKPASDKDDQILVLSQRSGSCSMSSLLAAMLHHYQNRELYYLHRLLLGQEILSDFLKRFEDNADLKTILRDGLELFERKIFSSIPSGLAIFTIQYLEEAYSDLFKNSMLIGSGHSNWLIDKKEKAILELSSNEFLVELLKSTLDLGSRIMKILKDSPVDFNTTSITIKDSDRIAVDRTIQNYYVETETNPFVMGTLEVEVSDPYKFFKVKMLRPAKTQISSLNEFIAGLKACYLNSVSAHTFSCILDAYKQISNERWWTIINPSVSEDLIGELLVLTESISLSYLHFVKKIRSLDTVTLLSCLQLTAWKAAQVADIQLNHRLGLQNMGPPLVIQNFFSLDRFLKGNSYIKKFIWSNFDSENNLKFLQLTIDELNNNEGKELFAGPFEFTQTLDAKVIDLKVAISKLNDCNRNMYGTIVNMNQIVPNNVKSDFKLGLSFILSNREKFQNHIPYFHQLLNTLFTIFWSIQPDRWSMTDNNMNLCTNNNSLIHCTLNAICLNSSISERYYKIVGDNRDFNQLLTDKFLLQSLSTFIKDDSNFFDSLEVDALADNENSIVNLETWLNYVKGALSSEIFSSAKFQFFSDNLLNVPIIRMNDNGSIDISPKTTYPKGFDKRHVVEIYESLFSLIKSDLNFLNLKTNILNLKEKSQVIKKVVNMSIILTRFLERIDNDKYVSGKTTAEMLANLYLELAPFGLIKRNGVLLEEKDVSSINLVLGYICYFKLRNSLHFYNLINEFLQINQDIAPFRRSLARVHLFLHKYTRNSNNYLELSMETDLADVGFQYLDIFDSEIAFLNQVFNILFLKRIAPNANWGTFKYSSDGIIGEAISSEDRKISVHFAEGLVIIDKMPVVNKGQIIFSQAFSSFFPEHCYKDALHGEAFRLQSFTIYVIENFRNLGINFVFILKDGLEGLLILREYNGEWYLNEKEKKFHSRLHLSECFKNHKEYSRIIKISNEEEYIHRKVSLDFSQDLPIFEANFKTFNDKIGPAEVKMKIRIGDNIIKCRLIQEKLIISQFQLFGALSSGVCQKKTGEMVYIFAHLRFENDLKNPIVIAERFLVDNMISSEFDLVNMKGYIVDSNQTVDEETALKGTLKVKNQEEERKLLVPIIQRRSINDPPYLKDADHVLVEMVPINNNRLCPQNRMQTLLLIFYAILDYNFNLARQLLHPNASFHQNEVFNINELKIMEWILQIVSKNPEAIALKMFVLIHFQLNKYKFRLDYLKTPKKLLNNIGKGLIAFDYLKVMRDLPDRYHITKTFSEIKYLDFFRDAFKGILNLAMNPENNTYTIKNSKFEFLYANTRDFDYDKSFSRHLTLEPTDLLQIFDIWNENPTTTRKKELILMTKLFMKQVDKESNPEFDPFFFNMAAYCLVNDDTQAADDLGIWNTAYKFAKTQSYNSYNRSMSHENFQKALVECKIRYQEMFKLISQNNGFSINIDLLYQSIVTLEIEAAEDLCGNDETFVDSNDVEAVKKFIDITDLKLNLLKEEAPALMDPSELFNNQQGQIKILAQLMDSMKEFRKKNIAYHTSINDEDLNSAITELRTVLQNRMEFHENELEELRQTLTIQTKHYTNINAENVIGNLIQLMHGKKSKLFRNLYSCYQQSSLKCFRKKFPLLNLEECRDLWRKTEEFYKRSILVNYFKFLIEKIDSLRSTELFDSISVEDLQNLVGELEKIFDFNERTQDKTVLNFEFMSQKYRLKPEQVKDIDHLTGRTEAGFKSIVIQRMMAAGKSLVLGTIAVVKKAASPDSLSILVPPSSLYQSNTISMQTRTYSYFKKIGKTLHFPRLSPNAKKEDLLMFLKFSLNFIVRTMRDRNYLILSPDSLHSFLNSYIEHLNYTSNEILDENSFKILQYFAKIYKIFLKCGTIILDEIDMTLDPKKEVNFPLSEREPYNMTAVNLITDLIEFAIFDQNVIKAGLDIIHNNQAKLSTEEYEIVRSILLDYIKVQLSQEDTIWNILITSKLQNIGVQTDNIIEFLKTSELNSQNSWIRSIGASGFESVMNALIIIRQELHQFLKDSLKATANLNYGLAGESRSNIYYAVPYVAANTPSTSSEFADRWETLNKTLLMLSSSACNREIARLVIKYIISSIEMEIADGTEPCDTATWKTVKKLNNNILNPLLLSAEFSDDVELIYDSIKSRSSAAIRILFSFCIDEVFSKMDFAIAQISSNALNMVSMFNSIQGYSGTIDNVNILPQEVIKDAYTDHMENEKNNGGIALKLLNNSFNRIVPEIEFFDTNLKTFMEDFMEKSSTYTSDPKAVIDAGAFFKNFTNQEIAKALLNYFEENIRVVLYYDEKSNLLQFVKKRNDQYEIGRLENSDPDSIRKLTGAEVHERFTFYDHRHITGSDILQDKKAQAILTVGTRTLLRDIFQGTLRMRQFMSSQKVHMLTTTAARKFLSSRTHSMDTVRVSDLLTLGALNEDDKQVFENEKLAFSKIDNEIRRFILKEITIILNNFNFVDKNKVFILVTSLFKTSQSLFVKSLEEKPLSWLRTNSEHDSKDFLQKLASSKIKILTSLLNDSDFILNYGDGFVHFKKRLGRLNQKFKQMISSDEGSGVYSLLKFIGAKIQKGLSNAGLEVEMQLETETLLETLAEVNIESLIESCSFDPEEKIQNEFDFNLFACDNGEKDKAKLPKSLEIEKEQFVSLNSILLDPKMSSKYTDFTKNVLFTDGLGVGASIDLVITVNLKDNRPFKIFSPFTQEGSHLLIHALPDNLGVRVLLVSIQIAQNIFKRDFQCNGKIFWLCDLSGRVTCTNDNTTLPGMNILEFMPASRNLIFDALIFNASLNQIISSPILNDLFYVKWLKSEYANDRAKFLLLRSTVLFSKFSITLSKSNPHLAILHAIMKGDLNFKKQINQINDVQIKKKLVLKNEIVGDEENQELLNNTDHQSKAITSSAFRDILNFIYSEDTSENIEPIWDRNQTNVESNDRDIDESYEDTSHLYVSSKNVDAWLHVAERPLNNLFNRFEPILTEDDNAKIDLEEMHSDGENSSNVFEADLNFDGDFDQIDTDDTFELNLKLNEFEDEMNIIDVSEKPTTNGHSATDLKAQKEKDHGSTNRSSNYVMFGADNGKQHNKELTKLPKGSAKKSSIVFLIVILAMSLLVFIIKYKYSENNAPETELVSENS